MIDNLQRGSEEALNWLMDRYIPYVSTVVRNIIGNTNCNVFQIGSETADDLRRAEEIRELTARIEALEAISGETDIREAAKASVIELSRVVNERDMDAMETAVLDINAYVLQTGEITAETVTDSLEGMKTRLESLRITAEGRGTVKASSSGIFSSGVDGYEHVRPSDVAGRLTPSGVQSLFSGAVSVKSGAFGKLIHGIRWYYVTILDTSWASLIAGRSTVEVEFSKTFNGSITMAVESVGQEENGKCAVVLSSTRHLSEMAGVRELTGEIILRSASGIRIPREAVHLGEEGETIVYVLEGIQARSVAVSIEGEEEGFYMVSGDGELKPGNQVILKADNLADGAVVMRDKL